MDDYSYIRKTLFIIIFLNTYILNITILCLNNLYILSYFLRDPIPSDIIKIGDNEKEKNLEGQIKLFDDGNYLLKLQIIQGHIFIPCRTNLLKYTV